MLDLEYIIQLIKKIASMNVASDEEISKLLYRRDAVGGMYSKGHINTTYHRLKRDKMIFLSPTEETTFLRNIRMKDVRTISGVTPVTVLTKPFPCPGKCIFCPNDIRMPKSYLSSEPGAQRASSNRFDPYLQTYNRLVAYKNIGHPTDKIELIILGGTWSAYPQAYQIWFVLRCFDAMNDFNSVTSEKISPNIKEQNGEDENEVDSSSESYNTRVGKLLSTQIEEAKLETATWEELEEAHVKNEDAEARCIGLVIETRPDEITEEEVEKIRRLGATKIQIGLQSLNDDVLKMNNRGHNVSESIEAVNKIRMAGFKIHAHWMPNLYGSSPEKDILDFDKLFDSTGIHPDELKIYPCSLIPGTELMDFYNKGLWKPYTEEELMKVLVNVLPKVPNYCRITRVIRDISSDDIHAGNKKTNFRQLAEQEISKSGGVLKDIRSREIKGDKVLIETLELRKTTYETSVSKEIFLEYITPDEKIAGFLRLSFPKVSSFISEISGNAMIREIHVYGQSLEIGEQKDGVAQHLGLGKRLIREASELSKSEGFSILSVISGIGTRNYYRKNNFRDGYLYQHLDL